MKQFTPSQFALVLEKHSDELGGIVEAQVQHISDEIQDRARALAPKETGFLAENIVQSKEADGIHVGVSKAAGEHANVLFGTGLYGEARHIIKSELHPGVPMGTSGGRTLFRASQRGTPRNKFWEEAVETTLSTAPARITLVGERAADIEE